MLTQVLLFQVLLPLILLVWLALFHTHTRFKWLFKTTVVIGYLVAIGVGMLWVLVPWYLTYIFLGLAILFSLRSFAQTADKPWIISWNLPTVITTFGMSAVMLIFIAINAYLLSGWIPKTHNLVNLSFPLAHGNYYAVNAGSNSVLNPHLKSLKPNPNFAPRKGQSYAVEIVKIFPWGLRAEGTQPTDPQHYAIYGEQVFAPCDGSVVDTENNLPEMQVPARVRDLTKPYGNFALLKCNDIEVLLAHLKQGSIVVKRGDEVKTGDLLAEVGNSGDSKEPSLLISAQKRETNQSLFSGEPLEILFDGDYLVRNERISP